MARAAALHADLAKEKIARRFRHGNLSVLERLRRFQGAAGARLAA
jgi:hypothetical protein